MSYPIPPSTPQGDTSDPAQHQAPPAGPALACPNTGGPLRRWLRAMGAALARAERRLTENFRVPPHGG
jgi:hypothetical protein